MYNSTLVMIQPGGFGDIIVCAPIAKKYHDNGYDVYWPVRFQFMDLISKFDYVNPILLNEESLDADWLKSDTIKCLDICQGDNFNYGLNLADRGPHPTAELPDEMPEQTKYRLSNVPFEEKHNLQWTRNVEKENSLYEEMVGGEDVPFVLCSLASSDSKTKLPIDSSVKVVEMDRKEGYVIFDWYKIIKKAQAIYAVESSFHCFIDGVINELSVPAYRLPRIPYEWKGTDYWTVSKNWTDIEGELEDG